jgi:hypothetical protein
MVMIKEYIRLKAEWKDDCGCCDEKKIDPYCDCCYMTEEPEYVDIDDGEVE